MANIYNDGSIYIFIIFMNILSAQAALGFGLLISIAAPSAEAAVGIAAPLILPLVIFSGYFLNNAWVI